MTQIVVKGQKNNPMEFSTAVKIIERVLVAYDLNEVVSINIFFLIERKSK